MADSLSELRELVYTRCRGYCEKCGKSLPEGWALHHRKLRSQGGKNEVVNFIALHHACHNMGTHAVHMNPANSYQHGYMVKSYADPAECPLTLPDGSSVMLTDEGTYQKISEGKNGW